MGDMELWHVFVDNGTNNRFFQHGHRDALTFNLAGDIMKVSDGKTEIPLEEWTDEELVWAVSGILKAKKRNSMATLPRLVLWAMKEYGMSDVERAAIMRKILYEAQKLV